MDYKYSTEEGIIMYMYNYYLIQEDELRNDQLKLEFEPHIPCTIYFICSRPRIIIDKDYIEFNEKEINLKFLVQKEDSQTPIFISIPNSYKFKKIEINSQFPYNFFTLINEKEEEFAGGKTCHFIDRFRDSDNQEFFDLKILYIGQSLDLSNETPLKKRLLNHSTLQEINSLFTKNNPDKEIFIIASSFNQNNILHSPHNFITDENKERDFNKLLHLMKNPSRFTLKQRTNFTEAALIRYFKPEFNDKFKYNFPDKKRHNSYTECFDLDVNMISVEVNTEDIKSRLFSDSIKPLSHHVARYHLHNTEDRRKMFEELI